MKKTDHCSHASYWSTYKIRAWNPRRLSDQVDLLPSWVFLAYGSGPVFGCAMVCNYNNAIHLSMFGLN